MSSRLLVIVPDAISSILKKGEFQPCYYNPGNFFDEVHILMTNEDRPDIGELQPTAGNAKLVLHNLKEPSIKKTFGYNPWFLRSWAKPAIDLAKEIQPHLIRCHGNWLNGYLAARIKRVLGVPYVVSLHTDPDEDLRKPTKDPAERKLWNSMRGVEKVTLRNADLVLPVYSSIVPYVKRFGARNIEVAYNVLNQIFLKRKEEYGLHQPVRILSVGRHFDQKNPENIIRAVEALSNAHLTLVGDGPLQEYLEQLVNDLHLEKRVTFYRAIPNNQLCDMLPDFDIFAVHVQLFGIAKAVIEALLTGLPVVINRREGDQVEELLGDHVLLVENSPEGYREAFEKLIADDEARDRLGRRAYHVAQDSWSPARTEAKYVEIYRRIKLKDGKAASGSH